MRRREKDPVKTIGCEGLKEAQDHIGIMRGNAGGRRRLKKKAAKDIEGFLGYQNKDEG